MHSPVGKRVSHGGNTLLNDLRRIVLSVQPQHPDLFAAHLFPFCFSCFRAFFLQILLYIGPVLLSELSEHLVVDAEPHDLQRFLRRPLQRGLHQRIAEHVGL